MANTVTNKYFPSQIVSDIEKVSYDYGLKVAQAIEQEWYYDNQGMYGTNYSMHLQNQRALFAPRDDQKKSKDVLDLIKLRASNNMYQKAYVKK